MSTSRQRRPNLVIFNPDQWRGDVMGHLGNSAAHTPNLDAFAAHDAVSFAQTYCQNPVCTPNRCSFMTGWYPHTRGHRTMRHMLHPERNETHLLRELKDAGYHVWWGGKNDLVPGQDGYDEHCTTRFRPTEADYQRWGVRPSRHADTHQWTDWRGSKSDDTYYSFYVGRLDPDPGAERFFDGDWATTYGACDFIRSASEDDQPFCLFLALGSPHPPYGVEEPYYSMIDRDKLPPRIGAPESWAGLPAMMQGLHRNFGLGEWTEHRWDELRAVYYGMCARVDAQFGMVVDALREAGLYHDTAVFMFSDHGDFTGDYDVVEKTQNTFQDCLTRVPMLIKPQAGVPVQPRVSDAMVELIDFTATCYELADVDPGYDHFGRSLLPVLAGETDEHRDAVFCEGGRRLGESHAMEATSLQSTPDPTTHLYYPRQALQTTDEQPYHGKAAACRTRRYKYVHRLYEQSELYDLQTDPSELHNRIDDPALAEVRTQLERRMLTWFVETGDVVPRQIDQRN